jgi:hypothetical protein
VEAHGQEQNANDPNLHYVGVLTALYVPFGPDGDNTLEFEEA